MTHNRARLTFPEIVDSRDGLLIPWLRLYEAAFPPAEREPLSTIYDGLQRRVAGEQVDEHLVAALDGQNNFVGMAMYAVHAPTAALLWYMAVEHTYRGRGIGVQIYDHLVAHCSSAGLQAVLFEVEIPAGPDDRDAQRRITFYRRRGARLLEGIHYLQYTGGGYPPLPMHLMIHPLQKLDAPAAFALACAILGASLQQTGPLALS